MEKVKTIKEYCKEWLETTPIKACFTVREIRASYSSYVWIVTGKRTMPYDDTFSRALRYLRAEGMAISYVDKNKAIWWRNAEPPKSVEEQKELVIKYNARMKARGLVF